METHPRRKTPVEIEADVRSPSETASNPVVFQKWIVEICRLLEAQTVLRFNELHNGLREIGTRTLSRKLSHLQEMGLVRRTCFDTNPPHVEYQLTTQGLEAAHHLTSLASLVDDVGGRGEDHL